jgi:hypothetical protein
MQIERKVNLGGFQTMAFRSSEQSTVQACARDLIAQMQPMATAYPALAQVIKEIKDAYQV